MEMIHKKITREAEKKISKKHFKYMLNDFYITHMRMILNLFVFFKKIRKFESAAATI